MLGVSETRLVHGEVILPQAGVAAGPADVIIQVEDISRADAPSVVVGEQRKSDILLRPGDVLSFAVEIPAEIVDARHHCSVRAHFSRSKSGEIAAGDLLSTQTYPVLTRGYGDAVRVSVKPV